MKKIINGRLYDTEDIAEHCEGWPERSQQECAKKKEIVVTLWSGYIDNIQTNYEPLQKAVESGAVVVTVLETNDEWAVRGSEDEEELEAAERSRQAIQDRLDADPNFKYIC